ncbi:hypothetical protein [Ruegeria atlantica]|uniref:hypothetical protein n=1 Tax=Ruegeria atlantica TaxID=81569 RepID=UPI002494DAF6|nr:hypothetical protein [Ruegeria atlantica]
MPTFKAGVLASIFILSASIISTAHADTVGCYHYKDEVYDSYKPSDWKKVAADLKTWLSTHGKHHPYYYTMQNKLVDAEYNLQQSKKSGYHKKKRNRCKDDVSPS